MAWKRSSVRIRYSPRKSRVIGVFFAIRMPFYVYILYSLGSDRYYVGETEDVNTRLDSHVRGISRYTSIASDWRVVYTECFKFRSEAIKQENEIKRKKSRNYIKWLIANQAR